MFFSEVLGFSKLGSVGGFFKPGYGSATALVKKRAIAIEKRNTSRAA